MEQSTYKCIKTFLRNRPYMMLIVVQNEDLIDTRIRNFIYNVGLFNDAKNLQSQLQPIASALDKLQSDSATIADACEVRFDLLQLPDLKPYSERVSHRFRQAMTPDHYLANLLHPTYRGKKLDSSHMNSAQEKLLECSPDAVPDLLDFMTYSVALPKALVHDLVITKTKPKAWWSSAERSNTVNETICKLAMNLLSMPSSSAFIRRMFSNVGVIQIKLRNRLGLQKSS